MKRINLALLLGLLAATPLLQGCIAGDPEDNPLLRFAWLPTFVTGAATTTTAGGGGAAAPAAGGNAPFGAANLISGGAGSNAVGLPAIGF